VPEEERPVAGTGSTRDRLIAAALALFAEHGLDGTTIGDIEDRAGLTRRGGGFYRHFDSKDAVLTAAVEAHVAQAQRAREALNLLPLGDLRSELTLVCRWLLDSIDQQRDLLQVIDREGTRFPTLRDLCRRELIDAVHAGAVAFTTRWTEVTGRSSADPEASAVVMIGAALSYRRSQWTYGTAPLAVDDRRFVETWVSYCHQLMTGTLD
jgi:AcrR family transcriptional regulator